MSRSNTFDNGVTASIQHGDKSWKNLSKEYKKDKTKNEMFGKIEAYPGFTIIQNKLYHTGSGRMQLYVPEGIYRDLVLRECHDAKYAGHLGMRKTAELIQRDFYWTTLVQDVEHYVGLARNINATRLAIRNHQDCCSL